MDEHYGAARSRKRKGSGYTASVLGATICVGVTLGTLLLLDAGFLRPSAAPPPVVPTGAAEPRVSKPPPTPVVREGRPAAAPLTQQVAPPMRPDRSGPRQHDVDAAALRTMMETCQFWARQDGAQSALANYQAACNRASQFAFQAGLPAPTIPRFSATQPESRAAQPTSAVRISVSECRQHTHGSVAYRECRGREAARLRRTCQSYRDRLQFAVGEQYRQIRALEQAYCAAADRYQIVQ